MFFRNETRLFPETYETRDYTVWSKPKRYVNAVADGTVFNLTPRITLNSDHFA